MFNGADINAASYPAPLPAYASALLHFHSCLPVSRFSPLGNSTLTHSNTHFRTFPHLPAGRQVYIFCFAHFHTCLPAGRFTHFHTFTLVCRQADLHILPRTFPRFSSLPLVNFQIMIAFLGTGLLGANFVKAMLKKGEQVQVWNRTAEKATALEAAGAKAFSSPAEAVAGADRIHLALSDDAAVDQTLEKASGGFTKSVIIIDHTTTSAAAVAARTNHWKEQGFTYIHAPVFMGPPNALESTGYMLISGDQQVIQQLTPILSAMTGKLINLGTEANRAAGMKLVGNLFLMSLTAGLSDMLALAKAMNITPAEIEALLAEWNPAAAAPARLKRILSNQFDNPSWELSMARKDAGLMMQEAKKGNTTLTIIPTIAAEMDRWIEKGHAKNDWTIIAKDNI